MNQFSRIFDLRKQSKKMDQTLSPKPKLVRRNAAKNFDYTPSSSSAPASTRPSMSGSSHRTPSIDLFRSVDQTSIRLDGSNGEVDSIFHSLGLSGPEDFEIPKAAWEALNNRFASDVARAEKDRFYCIEPEKPKNEEVEKVVDIPPHRFGNNVQLDDVSKVNSNDNQLKVPASSDVGGVDRGVGIKGDRPPLLNPPPAMSLPVHDDGCSTWELMRGFAPDDGKPYHLPAAHIYDDEERDETRREHNGVRIGETVSLSGSSSFTTSNDDDSSCTTTEFVSIISPNSGCKMNITHWDKGTLLGRGSFGTVYEGISSEGIFFAVKEVSLLEQGSQGKQSIAQLEQEIQLLSQFEHENIVRYLGTAKEDSKLYIFLELVTQGSLASLYQKYKLRDSHVSAYTRQILLGLKYLHDRKVVHRDIKCANILVASSGLVKLADFGLAKTTRMNDLKSFRGTAFWMAPEVVYHKNQGYGLAADIWSLGCTVLEMITRHVPYYPLEFMQAIYKIGRGEPPPIPNELSRDARDFIQQCLRVDPNDRPTAAELLEHPFVRRPFYAQSGSGSPMLPDR